MVMDVSLTIDKLDIANMFVLLWTNKNLWDFWQEYTPGTDAKGVNALVGDLR